MKTIIINCRGAADADLDELQQFQGDLKTLSANNFNRLKRQIETEGFSEPISVWRSQERKKGPFSLYILNGHQRISVLRQMKEDGYVIPRIPISFVEAPDRRTAKRKVLALTSQYGEMTEDGLKSFASEAELDLKEIVDNFRFPEINLSTLIKPPKPPVVPPLEKSPSTLVHTCPKCGHQFE